MNPVTGKWDWLVAVAITAGTSYGGLVPIKYQPLVGIGMLAGMGYLKRAALKVNPDGTPASVPYVPPTKSN